MKARPDSRVKPGARLMWAPLRAFLAAMLMAPAVATLPAGAEECTLVALADHPPGHGTREIIDDNVECLQLQIEALEREREDLARKIEQLGDQDTLATTVYVNRDGRVSRHERHLGPATFVLTGDRRGGPRSLELDRARVVEMCGDAEGCLISLGLTGIVIGNAPVEAAFTRGPCAFRLDGARNAWAVSGACASADLPSAEPGVDAEGGPAWGRDGDARPFAGAGQEGRVMLGFGGACLLTEAPPDLGPGSAGEPRFERDTSPDLFLVTTGAAWDPPGTFPADLLPLGLGDPDFQCSLAIRD